MALDSSSSARPPAPAPSAGAAPTNVLNQKFGPFPAWVYLAAIGVGLFAYEKNKGTKATSAKGTAAGGDSGTAGTAAATGAVTESALEQSLAANAQSATTNPQWEANVESVLVGQGYPIVQVQSALNTYLAGGVLSSIQQEIVNAAIEVQGAPPSPPASTSSTSSPTTPPPSTPTPTAPSGSNPAPATGTSTKDGYGTITIGGKQYAILGRAGQPTYQVSGGAPVYFGNANGVEQGGQAEAKAAADGAYAYVPVEYADLISSSPQAQPSGKF